MCKAIEEMRDQAVHNRDVEKITILFNKNWTAEQIIDVMEYDRDLVYSVQKELLRAMK